MCSCELWAVNVSVRCQLGFKSNSGLFEALQIFVMFNRVFLRNVVPAPVPLPGVQSLSPQKAFSTYCCQTLVNS